MSNIEQIQGQLRTGVADIDRSGMGAFPLMAQEQTRDHRIIAGLIGRLAETRIQTLSVAADLAGRVHNAVHGENSAAAGSQLIESGMRGSKYETFITNEAGVLRTALDELNTTTINRKIILEKMGSHITALVSLAEELSADPHADYNHAVDAASAASNITSTAKAFNGSNSA